MTPSHHSAVGKGAPVRCPTDEPMKLLEGDQSLGGTGAVDGFPIDALLFPQMRVCDGSTIGRPYRCPAAIEGEPRRHSPFEIMNPDLHVFTGSASSGHGQPPSIGGELRVLIRLRFCSNEALGAICVGEHQ